MEPDDPLANNFIHHNHLMKNVKYKEHLAQNFTEKLKKTFLDKKKKKMFSD